MIMFDVLDQEEEFWNIYLILKLFELGFMYNIYCLQAGVLL